MKRRTFLKTPGIGFVLPSAVAGTAFSMFDPTVPNRPQEEIAGHSADQKLHPDFQTYLQGIEYFYLGNGDIAGAVQYCPKDPRGTFLGFTLMDPENFCRKWSTFLYHPEKGLSSSRLGVITNDPSQKSDGKSGMYVGIRGKSVTPENLVSIGWKQLDGVPVVSLVWRAGVCNIEEEYFAPSEGAILFRRIHVTNSGTTDLEITLTLSLYANFGLFSTIHTDENEKSALASGLAQMKLLSLESNVSVAGRYDVQAHLGRLSPGDRKSATYAYVIKDGERVLRRKGFARLWNETKAHWKGRSSFSAANPILDSLFDFSRTGITSVISRSGRNDAGIWQYNMEWLQELVLAMEALLRTGYPERARVLLEKNLKQNIGFDGRTIESSRWFGFEYTELVQNGVLLYEAWVYASWTGDYDLIMKYWRQIRLCGDFPLMEVFLDPRTTMVRNKREFWERSDSHGVENGYELAYQFWVAFGWEKGALLAEKIGDKATAKRWTNAASAMKQTMFHDAEFKLIQDGHLIKRRTVDGRWQKNFYPPDRKRLPAGSPIAVEQNPSCEPDTVEVFPIIYEMIDPRGVLATKTLDWVDQLWSQAWEGGGYPRYHVSSEDNPPAAWPIPSVLVARAYASQGNSQKVWRILNWLYSIPGGKSGSLFERLGQSITPPMPPVGVNGWVWYELIALCIHHLLGFRPELDRLVVRPFLLDGISEIRSQQRLRGSTIDLTIRKSPMENPARVNGKNVKMDVGSLVLSYPLPKRVKIEIDMRA